jgi:transcriptional regulator with XRE-family HTH domain
MTEKEILTVLKEARLQQKVSQEKLSFELGCDSCTVSQTERGDTTVSLYRLLKWAKYLGLELIIQPIQK